MIFEQHYLGHAPPSISIVVYEHRDDTTLQLVDVRQPGETAGGVIDGANVMPLTRLSERYATLAPTKPTIVYCAGGFRSSIASSKLAAIGFSDVSDLLGGYNAWVAAQEPSTLV